MCNSSNFPARLKATLFITHDLDKAIRMGNRIAIMKEGEIVQIGTPEEIVTNSADEYVADFVAGFSKLNLIFTHPIEFYTRNEATLPPIAERLTADPERNLAVLVTRAVDQENPIIMMSDGIPVGIVTKHALLHGIKREV